MSRPRTHNDGVKLPSLLCLLSLTALPAQEAPSGLQPAQPRVVWTESPQTRALVAWSTADASDVNRVYYDELSRSGELEDYRWKVDCQRSSEYSGGGLVLDYHHAQLDGLRPATTYYLVLVSGDEASREFHFRTAPDGDAEFAILSGGDSRSDRDARRQMNRAMSRLLERDPSILALAHGGDYVYWGGSLEQWSHWLTDHELTTTPAGRLLPVIPARGNHEAMGPLFDEVFGWPGGGFGQNYFVTELTSQVVLVTLNTEVAAGGDQREFLERTLADHADTRWKIVQYHRAVWPAVKGPARVKPHWQPLFEEHEVDLVCESDGHVLKRTVPIRGEAPSDRGVVYIGEGGLGVKQRTPQADRWYLGEPGHASPAHHVWILRLRSDELELEAVGTELETLDRHTLSARR